MFRFFMLPNFLGSFLIWQFFMYITMYKIHTYKSLLWPLNKSSGSFHSCYSSVSFLLNVIVNCTIDGDTSFVLIACIACIWFCSRIHLPWVRSRVRFFHIIVVHVDAIRLVLVSKFLDTVQVYCVLYVLCQ